jgi:hypothetical protein
MIHEETLARCQMLEEALRKVYSLLIPRGAVDQHFHDVTLNTEAKRIVHAALATPATDYLATVKREAVAEALEAVSRHVYLQFSLQAGNYLANRAAAIRRGEK